MSSFHRIETLVIPTNEQVLTFNMLDTAVFLHDEQYKGFDHWAQDVDDGRATFYWRINQPVFDEVIQDLMDIGVPVIHAEEPSEIDREAWEKSFGEYIVKQAQEEWNQ